MTAPHISMEPRDSEGLLLASVLPEIGFAYIFESATNLNAIEWRRYAYVVYEHPGPNFIGLPGSTPELFWRVRVVPCGTDDTINCGIYFPTYGPLEGVTIEGHFESLQRSIGRLAIYSTEPIATGGNG